MKFWQSLVFVEIDQVIALAQFCEELGFYGVSVADHLVTTKVSQTTTFSVKMGISFGTLKRIGRTLGRSQRLLASNASS